MAAVSEGSGLVTLTIQTTDGKTLTEKVFVSVYKKMDPCRAKSVKAAGVYRGASDNAGVENEDKKGTLAKRTGSNGNCHMWRILFVSDKRWFGV